MPIKSQTKSYHYKLIYVVLATAIPLWPFQTSAQNELDTTAELTIPALVEVLNTDRVREGLHPLRRNSALDEAARLKAEDMVANKYFAHTSPAGVEPWHWFKTAGYSYLYAGENLALDFEEAATVQKAWMNSPKHRDNIVNPDYEEVGYAIAQGTFNEINGVKKTRSGVIIVQLFGRQLPSVLAALNSAQEPLLNPVGQTENIKINPLTLDGLAIATNRLSSRMLGSVIDYSVPKTESQEVVIKPKTFNTTPPYTTWPVVSLGLALMMFSAGMHTKFL